MIFARDKSQMCNNLLQFAHVYAWGREHGRHVISMRFSYKYPFFKIRHTRYASFFWYLVAKYAAALRLLPTASFKHSDCDHKALEQKMLHHRNIVVSGWNVRFYDLFLKYRSEICDLFTIDEVYTNHVDEWLKSEEKNESENTLRLGVHIRRGDYAKWKDGRYCYDDKVFASHIVKFRQLHPEAKTIHVYLATNDPNVTVQGFKQLCPDDSIHFHLLGGNPVEDLYLLSQCDYLIGPPSTYSLVASMYRDIPIYRMDTPDAGRMEHEGFSSFDRLFRIII